MMNVVGVYPKPRSASSNEKVLKGNDSFGETFHFNTKINFSFGNIYPLALLHCLTIYVPPHLKQISTIHLYQNVNEKYTHLN